MNLKQLITIWTHDLLEWLTSKFDSITVDISDLAKEANATANKEAIITAVNNAQPDLSTIAKQGSNPNTSLTVVDEKIDNFYDTFDADIALQLQGIIGDTKESVGGTSQTATQVEELRTLQESYDELANKTVDSQEILTKLESIINTHIINNVSIDGYTFIESIQPNSAADICAQKDKLKIIDDSNVPSSQRLKTITAYGAFKACNNLESVTLTDIETITGSDAFSTCSSLTYISMPSLKTMGGGAICACKNLGAVDLPNLETLIGGTSYLSDNGCRIITLPKLKTISGQYIFSNSTNLEEMFLPELENIPRELVNGCTILKRLYIPKINIVSSSVYSFTNCLDLIDIETGAYFNRNMDFNTWSPTNALDSSSSSLVDSGETFANNLEKLLYNIREHIAANLPDRTGLSALTITFSAAVKTAILADVNTANAFADKNWTVS